MNNDGCEVHNIVSGNLQYTLIVAPGAVEHHAQSYGQNDIPESGNTAIEPHLQPETGIGKVAA